jgi:Glycosyl transferases group 1
MPQTTILFLCRTKNFGHGQHSLARALERQGAAVVCAADDCEWDEDINRIMSRLPVPPDLIIQPELDALLPWGLTAVSVPTACIFSDPYAYLHRRLRWGMMFDTVLLRHPGFEETFRAAGHGNPVTLPHAVDREYFNPVPKNRPLDIGWVGRSAGPMYTVRRRVLEGLSAKFRMNRWDCLHSYEGLAEVFCSSKLVVNVGRDDFPTDVSLHFAESGAAGALFITLLPSEMSVLGFQEGVHYVGVRSEAEIYDVVRYYLDHDAERIRIADAGREKVLREHTYDNRARFLLNLAEKSRGQFHAPARKWPEWRTRTDYIDYYSSHRVLASARRQLVCLLARNPSHALEGTSLIGRACWAVLRQRVGSVIKSKARRIKPDGFRDNER